jgi:hypothetical protein
MVLALIMREGAWPLSDREDSACSFVTFNHLRIFHPAHQQLLDVNAEIVLVISRDTLQQSHIVIERPTHTRNNNGRLDNGRACRARCESDVEAEEGPTGCGSRGGSCFSFSFLH